MPSVCFYFQVHQPYRLREFRFFDIGVDNDYEDVKKNRAVMQKVAEKCYLPMNALMLELIKRHQCNEKYRRMPYGYRPRFRRKQSRRSS